MEDDPEITQEMDILTDHVAQSDFGIIMDDDTEELEPVPDEAYEEETALLSSLPQEKMEFEDPILKKPIANQNLVGYKLPSQTLLDPISGKNKNFENIRAAKEKAQALLSILGNFDIEAQLLNTHIGPAVTQFEIR